MFINFDEWLGYEREEKLSKNLKKEKEVEISNFSSFSHPNRACNSAVVLLAEIGKFFLFENKERNKVLIPFILLFILEPNNA